MAFQLTRLVRSAAASTARRVVISRPLSSSVNAHAADKFVVVRSPIYPLAVTSTTDERSC